jgi:MarR family transcriptional regulator, negative regulator of the multidrug operon emrRAB
VVTRRAGYREGMAKDGAPPSDGDPESAEAVVDLMAGLVRVVLSFLADSARAARLGWTDFLALLWLTSAGGMTGVELAGVLGITSSSISELGDRLVQRGMISRTRPRHNRRIIQLKGTARGRRVVEQALAPVLTRLLELVVALNESDRALVARLLTDIGRALEQIAPGLSSAKP